MLETLFQTDFSCELIFALSDGEGESRETFVDLYKERTSALWLQIINLRQFSLENGASCFILFGDTFSRGSIHVKSNNVTRCKLVFICLLSGCLFVDNHIVTVDQMLLDFVWKHSLNWIAAISFACFGDGFSNFSVCWCLLNYTLSSLESVPCSEDDICLLSIDSSTTDDMSSGCIWCEAIEVTTAHSATRQVRLFLLLTSLLNHPQRV